MDFDADQLKSRLKALTHLQRFAFLLSICERLSPNYRYFSAAEGWGDPELLREALDLAWSFLQGVDVSARAEALGEKMEENTPDTDDFDSVFVSSALDAAVCTSNLLGLIRSDDVVSVVEGASLARDTVDMYVQELLALAPGDRYLEAKILDHPLMKRELLRQSQDVELLAAADLRQSSVVAELKKRWRDTQKSNIDLG